MSLAPLLCRGSPPVVQGVCVGSCHEGLDGVDQRGGHGGVHGPTRHAQGTRRRVHLYTNHRHRETGEDMGTLPGWWVGWFFFWRTYSEESADGELGAIGPSGTSPQRARH